MLKQSILMACWTLASAHLLSAATYYVNSSTGDDSRTAAQAQSASTPWLTLHLSIPKLIAGDTLIATGTFSEARGYGTPWMVSGSGAAGNPITIQANNATINLQDNSADTGIYIFTGSYVVLDGFGFTSTLPTGAYMGGFFSFDGSNCIAKNCVFTNAYGSHDTAAGGNDHLVCIQTHGNFNTFSNLFFHEINDADLFRVWGTNNLITCCIASNCLNQYYDSGGTKLHADLMQFWYTGIGSVSNVIERCLFLNNGGNHGANGISGGMMDCRDTAGILHTNACHDITYRNNVFAWHSQWIQNYAPGFHLYNNVFYQCGSASYNRIIDNANAGSVNVRNNVFINNGYSGSGNNGSTNDYCAWDSASQSDSPSLSSSYGASNFVTTATACGFVNASNLNFRLTPSSILRGRGVNLSSDPSASAVDLDGNARPSSGAWDIGPYQYSARVQRIATLTFMQIAPLTIQAFGTLSRTNNLVYGFGDGSSSTNTNPIHTYTNAGAYTLSLTATDGSGRILKTQCSVTVTP